MAREERVLSIDIGATSIKLCEFEFGRGAGPTLMQFAYREYEEELSEGTRMNVVSGLLRQMLAEGGFKAKKALVSLSGQSALIRFGRLAVVNFDKKQIRKTAEFEATNNIPFPLSEVIYDYQLIAPEGADQIDVLSVVIKNEVVDQFARATMSVGCEPIHMDVAPVACFNASRANGLGDEGCSIILNIGGRNTSLLFAEGDRFFARNIPTAGHSITQQIAKEFGIGLPEAEELKRRHGFVALGGAYAEPESETAANVSKIIRSVMARLHGEIARSISVYRSQQHGSQPTKMYLTGGSSILTYCDVFFQEKLGIPVEYLNPFQIVNFGPTVDVSKLSEVAHMFSETVGLALRYSAPCPIEIDLVPARILRQQRLQAKKPFLFMAGLTVMMTLGIFQYGITHSSQIYEVAARNLESSKTYEGKLKAVDAKIAEAQQYKANNDELELELMKKCLLPSIYHEIALLRPDYLTITSIRPVYDEESLDMTMIDEPEAPVMPGMEMSGGGDMSSMGTGMGTGMGMDGTAVMSELEPYTSEEKIIYGYEIIGFCMMPNKSDKQIWNPGQDYWTDFGNIIDLPLKGGEEGSGSEESTGESGDAEGKDVAANEKAAARKLAREQFAKARERMAAMTTPDQAFMENLLASPLFDASVNPKHAFVSKRVYAYPVKGPERHRYLMNWFSIKVKLAENARITYNEYKSTASRNSTGMSGDGMMR